MNQSEQHQPPTPDLIVVRFDDLMAVARQIIAEQMDDCDEEFMAGRAHGVGSLHSEILELSKRTVQDQGREHEQGQDEILALHRQLAGEKLRADQGWERAEAKSRECIQLRERMTGQSESADVAANALSALLWLYRRLPPGYGRLAVIDGPIKALARQVSIDVTGDLAERGPEQKENEVTGAADERT